jgi:DNA polymerase/3'-5' exonuclease PolX
MKLDEARQVAEEIVAALAPACERVEIAGSIRRCVPEVKDVEIVFIAKTETFVQDLFGDVVKEICHADLVIADLIDGGVLARDEQVKRWGPKYKRAIHCSSRMVVELFRAQPDNWGYILALRTGPAGFNKIWAAYVREGGCLPSYLRLKGGYVWQNGERVVTATEESFFATILVRCWPPEERARERLRAHLVARGQL